MTNVTLIHEWGPRIMEDKSKWGELVEWHGGPVVPGIPPQGDTLSKSQTKAAGEVPGRVKVKRQRVDGGSSGASGGGDVSRGFEAPCTTTADLGNQIARRGRPIALEREDCHVQVLS
eukprot:GHVN01031974.1.p1 GENE.GHVN01031974.1~~GHVN01031974.1.p1  ORF type:complete len:117 (-),score=15.49 GHVN01031974.1:240-590(-)